MRVSIDLGHQNFPVVINRVTLSKDKDAEKIHSTVVLKGTDEAGNEIVLTILVPDEDSTQILVASELTKDGNVDVSLTLRE